MLSRLTILSTISVVALAACATPQENPFYKHSSKYQGPSTTSVAEAPIAIQTAPVSYEAVNYDASQQATYTRVNHECLKSEKNHELLGAGIGGTLGAIAGKKLIGGTQGAVIGAGLGGSAGYGIGDKVVNCDPEPMVTTQAAPIVSQAYASPTDTEFTTISEEGTPGYQVLQAQTVEIYDAPSAVTSAPSHSGNTAAEEVSYDYSANTVQAAAATTAISSETRLLNGTGYGSHVVKQGDTVYSLSRQLCVGVGAIQSLNDLDASYGINIGDQLQLPASNC